MRLRNWRHRAQRATCLVVLLAAGCAEEPPPRALVEITMTGSGMRWMICDPGMDGRLGTADDLLQAPPLHLPAHTPTRIVLHSSDYIYTFELPEQHMKEIAVPEQTYVVEFQSGKPRTAPFRGDQFCGYAHEALSGSIIVESWADYRRWQRAARPPGSSPRSAVKTANATVRS